MHYLFSTPIEDATLNTLSDLIERTVGVADLPLSTFQAPSVTVCAGDCTEAGESEATLSDSYKVAWQVRRRGGCAGDTVEWWNRKAVPTKYREHIADWPLSLSSAPAGCSSAGEKAPSLR